jgi:hypothetical protein
LPDNSKRSQPKRFFPPLRKRRFALSFY